MTRENPPIYTHGRIPGLSYEQVHPEVRLPVETGEPTIDAALVAYTEAVDVLARATAEAEAAQKAADAAPAARTSLISQYVATNPRVTPEDLPPELTGMVKEADEVLALARAIEAGAKNAEQQRLGEIGGALLGVRKAWGKRLATDAERSRMVIFDKMTAIKLEAVKLERNLSLLDLCRRFEPTGGWEDRYPVIRDIDEAQPILDGVRALGVGIVKVADFIGTKE